MSRTRRWEMVCLFLGTLKVTKGHRWSEPEWCLCRKNSSHDISESEICDADVRACLSGMLVSFVKWEFLIFGNHCSLLSTSQLYMLMYSIFTDWILKATSWANWLSNSVRLCDCPMLCLLPSSLSGKYSNGWYGNLWMSCDLKCKAGSPEDELAPCCTLSTTQPDIRIPVCREKSADLEQVWKSYPIKWDLRSGAQLLATWR